jgi:hypothetical protein
MFRLSGTLDDCIVQMWGLENPHVTNDTARDSQRWMCSVP